MANEFDHRAELQLRRQYAHHLRSHYESIHVPNKTIAVSARRSRVKHIRGTVQHQRLVCRGQTKSNLSTAHLDCAIITTLRWMNSLGLRHTRRRYRRSVPTDGYQARVNHAHPPLGIAEASRVKLAKPRVPVTNQPH